LGYGNIVLINWSLAFCYALFVGFMILPSGKCSLQILTQRLDDPFTVFNVAQKVGSGIVNGDRILPADFYSRPDEFPPVIYAGV
jgi:hypothetical protein